MPFFILDEAAQTEIAGLRAYAEAHPFTKTEMEARQLVEGKWAPGDAADFTRHFIGGTKVVFTVEATKSGQFVRHLSMSVGGRLPFPFVVQDLMSLLGFYGTLGDCLVDMSEEPHAVNILQYLTQVPV